MRQIDKGHPPKNAARSDQPPRPWLAFREDLKVALRSATNAVTVARGVFDTTDRERTTAQLLHEQHHLCIFCEQRIVNRAASAFPPTGTPRDPEKPLARDRATRRAHWTPIHVDPQAALDWTNVYGSCSSQNTCDTRQGMRDLGLPHPCGKDDLSLALTHHEDGTISVSPRADAFLTTDQRASLAQAIGTKEDPGVLNLNHRELCRARIRAVTGARKALESRFRNQRASRQDRQNIAREAMVDPHGREFISAVLAWLTRQDRDLRNAAPSQA